jgi:hypothetical protein
MPQEPLGKDSRWADKVTRSVFFLSALLFHLVLFMAVAGWIVFRAPATQSPDTTIYIPTPPVPPPTNAIPVPQEVIVNLPTPPSPIPEIPTTLVNSRISVPMPRIGDTKGIDNHTPRPPSDPVHATPSSLDLSIQDIKQTVIDKWHMTPEQIANHDPTCTFPVYVASYANGDWACNTRLDKDGNIVAGSIPDLVAKINEWSHGAIKGEVVSKPLDIASPDLLDKMPPFIFFTGHKDFVLTDAEIENLRKYLIDGGMIWGDNALAGEGSRFDVAFHREMKRVIPDEDKKFMPYSLTDDIFAKGRYPMTQIPAGMNYYAEAPQHLDIDGILAILYTPNDYSDIMFMRILPGDKSFFMTYRPIPPGTLYTDTAFVEKQSIFYRNFNLDTALAVHRMGMNIISYMLVRFDDKLLLSH